MSERGVTAGARLIARASLRRQWLAVLAVTLLIGIAGAAVLATAAGARRTATAMDRFEAFSQNADIEITLGPISSDRLKEFEADPAIAEVAPLRQFAIVFDGQSEFLPSAGALDDRFGTIVDRARVIRGRVPDLTKPNEVAIGETLAERLHLNVGDALTGKSYSPADIEYSFETNDDPGPHGPPVRLDVVGIVRRPLDLSSRGAKGGVVVMTPAFTAEYLDKIGSFAGTLARVRATNSVSDAITAARDRFKDEQGFSIQPLAFETEGTSDAITVLTLALALFAAIAGIAGLVFITIVMQRQLTLAERDQVQLTALGASRRARMLAVTLTAVPMMLGGAALAVAGAVVASTFFPLGVARRAEPNTGFSIDGVVLGFGFTAIVVATLAIALFAAWRVTRPARSHAGRDRVRPSQLARAARHAGCAPTMTTGVGFAFETGRGRTAVPVRSAIVGAILGIAGVAAVLTYAASFDRLVATPARYGWSVSGLVRSDDNEQMKPGQCNRRKPAFVNDPTFAMVGIACSDSYEVDGRSVTVWGFRAFRGTFEPTIVSGRAARTPDEITLGAVTLDAIGKRIGDHVTVTTEAGPLDYEIVGTQVLPVPSNIDPLPFADNAGMTAEGFERALQGAQNEANFDMYGTLADSKQPSDFPKVEVPFDSNGGYVEISPNVALLPPTVPDELTRVRQVDQLPVLLGAFLAFLGLAAVAHTLFASVRRRGRDLAILRALGFRRRQVRGTIGWEATALATVGVLVGLPIGVLIGRFAWTAVADNLGVVSTVTVPAADLVALTVAAIAVVILVALVAARRATRPSPATALTVE